MTTPKIILLTTNGGGSGQGFSHYTSAATCGRTERLSQEYTTKVKNGEVPPPATKNHFSIGSAYHMLHELWRCPPPEGYILDQHEIEFNDNAKEAVRLFKAYQKRFLANLWGTNFVVEHKLPNTPEAAAEVAKTFFGLRITGKPDMVSYMDDAAVARANLVREIHLPRAGWYIVDFKTASALKDDSYYSEGAQAILYPYLWEIQYPDKPIVGTIYDIVVRNDKKKDKTPTFHAVYSPYERDRIDMLKGTIAMAAFNLMLDIPNYDAAVDKFTGELNFFIKTGANDRKLAPGTEEKLQKIFDFIATL